MPQHPSLPWRLNALPLLRPWGLPRSLRHVCCIVRHEHLELVGRFCQAHPELRVERVIVPDLPADAPRSLSVPLAPQPGPAGEAPDAGARADIPLAGLDALSSTPQWEKVALCPVAWVLGALCRLFAAQGVRTIYLDGFWPPPFGRRAPLPDFYRRFAPQLNRVYALLADDADRETYAARVKAILTGDAGYLPIAGHEEYFHPEVHPEPGDIMIDGGVSDMVGAQQRFAESVGPAGQVHGFEPIPWMAESARKSLAAWPQYHLHCAGLAEEKGQARFASLRDSSHICGPGAGGATSAAPEGGEDGTVLCDLVRIDDMVRELGLERVDCIKLDVEGAELSALRGAEDTIRRFAPRLIICLYHQPEDLVTIPLYVKSLNPAYRLHVSHSSCEFTDTILYARADAPHGAAATEEEAASAQAAGGAEPASGVTAGAR